MYNFINFIVNEVSIKILIIVIVLDTIFGVLRAIKEKNVNSCIGIDGIIRKIGMIIAILFLRLIDFLIDVNLIGFIPSSITDILNLGKIGISDIFSILFIIFETLSIFKNAILCKLPIPKKLQQYLEKIMNEFTSEINYENSIKSVVTSQVKIENPKNVTVIKEEEKENE